MDEILYKMSVVKCGLQNPELKNMDAILDKFCGLLTDVGRFLQSMDYKRLLDNMDETLDDQCKVWTAFFWTSVKHGLAIFGQV